MSNEELVVLIQAGENVKENMAALCEKNRGLIASVAKKYSGTEEMEDLMQEGYFGLFRAAEKYSPDKGSSFAGYALWWIRQAITAYIRDNGSIKMPAHRQESLMQYKRLVNAYQMEYGRNPTEQETMYYLEISSQQYEGLREAEYRKTVRSLEEPIGEEDYILADNVSDGEGDIEATIKAIDTEQMKEMLWSFVDDLEEQQSEAIKMRYKEGLTLKAAGERTGKGLERIRQLEAAGLRKLRSHKYAGKLKPYYDEYLSAAIYHGSSLRSFRYTHTSSVERMILQMEERV